VSAPPSAPIDPLPQRRADGWAVEGELMPDGPAIPRQVPTSPEAAPSRGLWSDTPPGGTRAPHPSWSTPDSGYGTPVSAPPTGSMPVSGVPVSSMPVSGMPTSSMPVSGGATTAPPPSQGLPVWPPVSSPAPAERPAYDFTSEFPTVSSAPPAPAGQPTISYVPPAPAMAERAVPYADETMELPIFRELESAWFRTRKTATGEPVEEADVSVTAQFPRVGADDSAAQYRDGATGQYRTVSPPEATGQYPTVGGTDTWDAEDQRSSTMAGTAGMADMYGAGDRPNGGPVTVPAGYAPPAYTPSWQTAADEGWAAASALASDPDPEEMETTGSGLPKRTPMAQLVPGGIDKATTTTQRRTPEGVRGLLSAYHRGVQRGRTQQKDEDSTAGSHQNGRQAGKEHEA
jgi:hypothetical protein